MTFAGPPPQVHNLSGPIRFEDNDGPAMPGVLPSTLQALVCQPPLFGRWLPAGGCLTLAEARIPWMRPHAHAAIAAGDLLVVEICNLGPLPGVL